jgi:hypothetical protein
MIRGMSRGIGARQRSVIDALVERSENDSYDAWGSVIRARWRWYTLDLLDLVPDSAPRSQRVSLHRAVRCLHQRGLLEIAPTCPYRPRHGRFLNEYGDLVGGLDISELSSVDPRWPTGPGRVLWFRLPAPSVADDDQSPLDESLSDDQIYWLEDIVASDVFADFSEALNRREAWTTEAGRLIQWLFCGPLPEGQRESLR